MTSISKRPTSAVTTPRSVVGGGFRSMELSVNASSINLKNAKSKLTGQKPMSSWAVPPPLPIHTPAVFNEGGHGLGATSSSSAMDTDYVNTLQQQVQLLETQLALVKEKGLPNGKDVPETDIPIESVVRALRAKYKQVAADQDKEMQSVAKQNEQLEQDKVKLQLENARLTEAVQTLKQQFHRLRSSTDAARDKWIGEKVSLEQRLSRAEQRLTLKTQDYDALVERTSQEKSALRVQLERVQGQLRDKCAQAEPLERKLAEKNRQIREIEVKMIELGEQLATGTKDLEDEVQQLREKNVACEVEKKRLEIAAEQAKASASKQEEVVQQLLNGNAELRVSFQTATEQVEELKKQWTDNERRGRVFSQQLVDLRRENMDLKQQMGDLPAQLEARQNQIEQLRHDMAEALSAAEEKEHVIKELQDHVSRLEKHIKIVEDGNLRDEHELAFVKEQFEELRTTYDVQCNDLEQAKKERDEAVVTRQLAEAKLAISTSMEGLDLDKLHAFMATNLQVASTIQNLMPHARTLSNLSAGVHANNRPSTSQQPPLAPGLSAAATAALSQSMTTSAVDTTSGSASVAAAVGTANGASSLYRDAAASTLPRAPSRNSLNNGQSSMTTNRAGLQFLNKFYDQQQQQQMQNGDM